MFQFNKQFLKHSVRLLLIYTVCGPVFADVVNNTAEAGKIEYQRSCEICHGVKGKGDGLYASRLLTKPADLTVLARNNNGTIPIPSIYRMIDGRDDFTFHGSSSMPIWGNRYRSESISEFGSDNAQTFVRGRIFELLIFLDTLQAP